MHLFSHAHIDSSGSDHKHETENDPFRGHSPDGHCVGVWIRTNMSDPQPNPATL
ncbi:hypothetical protein ASPWEDRAFT_33576, partial [Aspergillus wentii DTO 134E9]